MAIRTEKIHFGIKLKVIGNKVMKKDKFNIVLGISAGIAAYKTIDLIKLLKQDHMQVSVIMTRHAQLMIDKSYFEESSKGRVYSEIFEEEFDFRSVLKDKKVEHIKVADSCDLLVIAPATADIIGKIANGIADDLLTTVVMATSAPVLICPSMNTNMWHNPILQENLSKLKNNGYYVLSPDKGRLACGYFGVGRLTNNRKIYKEIKVILAKVNSLSGKKIMITAGATTEPIDRVRVLTNRGSGKMGAALAQACYRRGAQVLLLKAASAVDVDTRQKRKGEDMENTRCLEVESFETGQELSNLIQKHIADYHIIFHTAAVSDYQPKETFDKKLDSAQSLILHLEKTTKILSELKKWNPQIMVIGFKAVYKKTDSQLVKIAVAKLKESQSDYIAANDVGRPGVGFRVDTNEVFLVNSHGLVCHIPKSSKLHVAQKILDIIF